MGKRILLVGTVDTKSEEIKYLRDEIWKRGCIPVVMDVGVLGDIAFEPDVSRREVGDASDTPFDVIANSSKSEHEAMVRMAQGASRLAAKLYTEGKFDAALAIGGTMATDLALDVMAALPIGVPKLVVSSVAFSHIVPPDRICADLMQILWAGGLWGMNSVCKNVLDNAIGAICGAAESFNPREESQKPIVAVSSLGSSCCKYLFYLKPALEERGYEVVVFHAVGMGGRALESLVAQGRVKAVLDLVAIEVSDHALGSVVSAGESRMETAGRMGIPQIVAPGAIGSFDFATWRIPDHVKDRSIHIHNRLISVALNTHEEKALIGKALAEKLNKAVGPAAMLIPLQGLEEWERPGSELHDPEGVKVLAGAFKAHVKPHVKVLELDMHINDKAFSDQVLALFDEMVSRPT